MKELRKVGMFKQQFLQGVNIACYAEPCSQLSAGYCHFGWLVSVCPRKIDRRLVFPTRWFSAAYARGPAFQLGPARMRPRVLATVELSVCPSVTRWLCVKTMQAWITKSSLTDRPRALVFQRFRWLFLRIL